MQINICQSNRVLFAGLLMLFATRQKKWQTCKDSNLNKVNQNHLCYRYTTGLRCVYNIAFLFTIFKLIIKSFAKNLCNS